MDKRPVPEALLSLRERIDAIDAELMTLLARRFEVTREVGRIKAEHNLESLDPVREEQKLDSLQAVAEETGLDPDFVYNLFQSIFREVVANHRRMLRDRQNA